MAALLIPAKASFFPNSSDATLSNACLAGEGNAKGWERDSSSNSVVVVVVGVVVVSMADVGWF
eukprot:CAMPEP_0183734550 /NCGR_PEP_ID=MMETSP0737-20130205/44093_1 /TAXON_ID=385413 /ORGANISM="Thalassiosira miniscula, Strain CCMP1093" /LENGTH=62 /DNA_ID=CAMNT_0025968055 /DNA_START=32 /DNA_END=220 /DNA_ORIENTATION=-